MRPFILVALLTLTACGADGPPVAPAAEEPAISITGDAAFGIRTKIN